MFSKLLCFVFFQNDVSKIKIYLKLLFSGHGSSLLNEFLLNILVLQMFMVQSPHKHIAN